MAFGAERWLATLQRTCERLTYLMDSTGDNPGGGIETSL